MRASGGSQWTPLADVAPALARAVVAAEDRRFRAHGGVDARALASAALGRLAGRPARGASTSRCSLRRCSIRR
jgi:penicillin-binding protein 1C